MPAPIDSAMRLRRTSAAKGFGSTASYLTTEIDLSGTAVASYVRSAWGNEAAPVTTDQVRALRQELRAKLQ